MSEFGYVEQSVIEWLSGKPNRTPPDCGLGWKYRTEVEMATYGRPLEDPLVEELLVDALIRINPEIGTPAQTAPAVAALRKVMGNPDRLQANRETLTSLQKGATVNVKPGEDAKTVYYIAFGANDQGLNDFTATNQYKVQGVKQCRKDTVLLVNGIPLVIAEYKSIVASNHDWQEAFGSSTATSGKRRSC